MEKSNSISSIATALVLFQLKVDKVAKDATNPFFKSKYASLSNIQKAIADPLAEAGLAYAQFPDGDHGLTTIIMHGESGEWLQSTYTMRPVKDDPQGIGSSITYQKRYALAGALALNIDDDDDANSATHGSKTPAKVVVKPNVFIAQHKENLNPTHPKWVGAVQSLIDGKTTIAKIEAVYSISEEHRQALMLAAV